MEIRPTPTDDEAAAIAAAVTVVLQAHVVAASAAAGRARDDTLHLWVEASRRSAQRAGLQRGSWRFSGRIARRARV